MEDTSLLAAVRNDDANAAVALFGTAGKLNKLKKVICFNFLQQLVARTARHAE